MSERLSDRDLDRLLAGLPRAGASRGFTGRVLGALDRPHRRKPGRRWLLAAAAVGLALAAGLLLRPRPRPAVADRAALAEEHRQLVAELEALKTSLRDREPAPLLYLGGDESVDLVLDLGPVWRGELAGGVLPAAYEAGEGPFAASNRRTGDQR